MVFEQMYEIYHYNQQNNNNNNKFPIETLIRNQYNDDHFQRTLLS